MSESGPCIFERVECVTMLANSLVNRATIVCGSSAAHNGGPTISARPLAGSARLLLLVAACLACLLFVGSPDAATVGNDDPRYGAMEPAMTLADLLAEDQLGYECVPEARLDAAFSISGKGIAMPQTCLPDPCEGALTHADYGILLGHMPDDVEWDDYYARYADFCRAEVTPFGEDGAPVLFASGSAGFRETFWKPLLQQRYQPPSRGYAGWNFGGGHGGSSGSSHPDAPEPGPHRRILIGGSSFEDTLGGSPTPRPDFPGPVTPRPLPNPPPHYSILPVPLPGAMVALLTATGLFFGMRRRRC
ncbi:hypothetical protein AB1M95_07575 [Sulfitobacter sp. LCG007]